jgi:thioredoxin 1
VANENEDIKVVKIDVDSAQDIAIKYQVMSIPTTVVIKDGKEVNRAVGMMSKSDLVEMVK